MKILIVHQYFNTPQSGGPLRSYYLACGLKSHGFQVEIITSHNGKSSQTREIEGFKVYYLPVFYDNSLGFAGRINAFIRFAWLAYKKARQIDAIDLCYAISTPLTVGWVAKRLKARRDIPFVFEVGDLWPEAPIQMGVIRKPFVINLLRRFEKSIYREASRVVALSPGIKQGILKNYPECQVSTIPNISDCGFYHQEQKDPALETKFGVKHKLVVTYFGAAGIANHLEYLLEAARYAGQHHHSLSFLIVAQGSELARLQKLSAKYGLDNLSFLKYQNRQGLKEVLNVTDAVYVSYAAVPVLSTGSPNKFFDGLAAGKLMIVNFKGWLKDITEQHKIGFYVDPQKPQMLSELLQPLVSDREQLHLAQANARRLAETFFSRNLSVKKLVKLLTPEESEPTKVPEVYNLTV